MSALKHQSYDIAEVELSQWQLLLEKMKAGRQEPASEVESLFKSVFRDYVLDDYPNFVKYFKNDHRGKPMEDHMLHKAAAATAAAQQRRSQQQEGKSHALHVALRWTLDLLNRGLARYRAWPPRVKLYLLVSYPEYSNLATAIGLCLVAAIILNTITYCWESLPSIDKGTYDTLVIIDYVCLGIFTTEFLIRLLTCNSLRRFSLKLMNWVDLAAILPFLVELAVTGGEIHDASKTRIFRTLRLLRVLRLMRVSSRFRNLQIVTDALASSLDVIGMLAVLLLVLLVVAGTVVYYVEDALVENNSLDSIPLTVYYMHVTLTTTGYGDLIAKSSWGRFVVGVFMLMCLATISLPIGVLGGNFSNLWSRYMSLRDSINRSLQAWGTRLQLRGAAAMHCAAVDELIATIHKVKAGLEEGFGGPDPAAAEGGLRAMRDKLVELQMTLLHLSASELEDSTRLVALRGTISDLRRRLALAECRLGHLRALLSLVPRVSSPDAASALNDLHTVHQSMATRASDAVRQATRARQQLADLRAMREVLRAEEAEVYGTFDGSYDGAAVDGGKAGAVALK